MSLSITNETKNNITIANASKGPSDTTWDEADYTWDEADGTWDVQGLIIFKEAKNSLTIVNENKV
jgi:hypothetical protein